MKTITIEQVENGFVIRGHSVVPNLLYTEPRAFVTEYSWGIDNYVQQILAEPEPEPVNFQEQMGAYQLREAKRYPAGQANTATVAPLPTDLDDEIPF